MADNPFFRLLLRFTAARRFLKKREHYKDIISEHFEGRDRLFFHAPAGIVLTYPKKRGHFGLTDCVLASQAMMYYAQSMGIGSCMIGYAEVAINRKKALRRDLGIAEDQSVGLVFTLGFTARKYRKLPHRKEMPVTFR